MCVCVKCEVLLGLAAVWRRRAVSYFAGIHSDLKGSSGSLLQVCVSVCMSELADVCSPHYR